METTQAQEEEYGRIEVRCGDHIEAFIGKWLVAPDPELTRAAPSDYEDGKNWVDAWTFWGVASTRRHRLAVYSSHQSETWRGRLTAYDTLLDAEEDGLPPSIAKMAYVELLSDIPVIELDI